MRITTITSTSTPSDSAQAIYGFTGAECDAFQILIRKLNAKTMPLSITWRYVASRLLLLLAFASAVAFAVAVADTCQMGIHVSA